jgi:two-component system sensor histidine kinase KdpD
MPQAADPARPDPDALLAHAKRADRGRLRVYLGMAPGVGKTYEMLAAAGRRRAEGVEVAVGVVETHGRRETEALLEGLDVLARAPMDYRGRTLMEFDLDGALARCPALLLVDEYAHSNAPGSRHPKRWQDVDELLEAGIDVWTTLNVQHLESLVDVVWRITGVRQRETVPDRVLSDADQIELVDITPEELRARMDAGKVYVPETARLAGERFFKLENLTALRELALRRAAETVDDQLTAAMRRGGIEGPWAAGERILVLVGGDPMASSLVRAGRRLADLMQGSPWTVAHVEAANRPPPGPERARRVGEALKLAEQLGAATLVLTGDDLPDAVLDYARRNNVTQIVLGKSKAKRWNRLVGRDLAQALLARSGGAALHFVTAGAPEPIPPQPRSRTPAWWRAWLGYAYAVGLTAAATGVSAVLDRMSSSANLAMIFLASVLVSGLLNGLRPALLAAALSILSYNFFFLAPRFSLAIGHVEDVITFAIFLGVAAATGWLSGRVRDQAQAVARRAATVTALLAASRRLSAAASREEAVHALAEQVSGAAGGRAVVLLAEGDELAPGAQAPETAGETPAPLSTSAMTAARWAFDKREAAGAGTGTLPQAGWTFRPLAGLRGMVGVAGYEASEDRSADDERLVGALLDQGAVGIERAELAAGQAEAEAIRHSERLRSALLNSISHDLRTPLSTVLGAATTLEDYGDKLEPAVRADLLESIREEAERLNRYVGDLLDMTRLEGDALQPRKQLTDVRDVLGAAVERVSRRLGERPLVRDFPAELSFVEIDPALLEQAVVNVLENAIAYSPQDAPIEIAAYEDRHNVVISVEDEGRGIPTAELEHVFDRFRRVAENSDRAAGDRGKGVGLGLSISKGFVEAMGGRIAAASPIHGDATTGYHGTRILFSLPKTVATSHLLL